MRDDQMRNVGACFVTVMLSGCAVGTALNYPPVPRGTQVDVYHGVTVADPYRGFEDPDAEATRRFVAEQNALASPWIDALPQRAWIEQRLTQLWNYQRYGVPRKRGGRYFYLRNDGLQNQSVLHVSDSLDAPGRVLLDPNAQRADATIALARFVPSPDGSLVAYALSDAGTDWEVWRFRRVVDGKDLPDELRQTKFWELSWTPDGSGVYYSRYPALPAGRGDDQGRPAVYLHRLGSAQSADELVYEVTDHPRRAPSASVTEDGRYLVISLFDGYEANGIELIDLRPSGAKPRPLFDRWDALYSVIGNDGDTFYVRTNRAAPRGRVIAVDARQPAADAWRTLIPESDATLETVGLHGGRLLASYLRDARGSAELFETSGQRIGAVPLPGLGTIAGLDGTERDAEVFIAYEDSLQPRQILRYDVDANATRTFRRPSLAADTSRFETRQEFFTSRDGTRVPMFITQRRGAPRDGDQPVMLYGYGGFDVALTPSFSPATLAWLEMGGTYVQANLRGGGEYGRAWHEAGTRTRKQNVFDDFIAAAEHLIEAGYTRPQRLAIIGRSNGGLLVAATLLQRPDLFAAALPGVGVLDMLRYQTASANARQWSSDYGLAENAEEFAALRAYSPVHNVKADVCYPATLITTAERDDRVVPWHSYKFAAELQRAQACAKPVLLRVETRAGHGAGKPVWMQIEDVADQWAFAAQALQMPAPGPGPAAKPAVPAVPAVPAPKQPATTSPR